jgi:hypothetical protein
LKQAASERLPTGFTAENAQDVEKDKEQNNVEQNNKDRQTGLIILFHIILFLVFLCDETS